MAEATTSMILQNVRVLSSGRTIQTGQAVDPRAPKSPTVTLVLTPDDAQKLELAKNEGRIGLSLRNPLDSTQNAKHRTADHGSARPHDQRASGTRPPRPHHERHPGQSRRPECVAGTDRREEAGGSAQAAAEEEARRKKAEPEKPRVVVDVYRGDKHVQESFR